jgi:tripartite ATP-independent transporter DctM subunit
VAISSILIPAMNEEGYEPSFSTAITVGSSTIGAIIPPSMLFIMFGCTTNVSISKIFIGGVIPGILLGLFQMAYILYLSKSKKHRDKIPNGTKLTVKESLHYLLSGLPTLVLPVIIMVGICTGIVTTTESAVLAVVYAMGYVLISGEMTVKQMWECFKKSVRTIGGCMIILSTASLFGYIMTAEMIPQKIIAAMLRISNDLRVPADCGHFYGSHTGNPDFGADPAPSYVGIRDVSCPCGRYRLLRVDHWRHNAACWLLPVPGLRYFRAVHGENFKGRAAFDYDFCY